MPTKTNVTIGYQILLLSRVWNPQDGSTAEGAAVVSNTSGPVNVAYQVQTQNDFQGLLTYLTTPSTYSGCGGSGCYLVLSSLDSMGWTSCPNGVTTSGSCQAGGTQAQPGNLFASLGGSLSASYATLYNGTAAPAYSLIAPVTYGTSSNGVESVYFAGPGNGWESLSCMLVGTTCTTRPINGPTPPPNAYGAVTGAFIQGSSSNDLGFTSVTPNSITSRVISVNGSNQTINTVTANGAAYPSNPAVAPIPATTGSPAVSGFQVVQFDRSSMAMLSNQTFQAVSTNPSEDLNAMSTALSKPVNGSNEATLWVVSSIGPINSAQAGSEFPHVAQQLTALGASFTVLAQLGSTDPYAGDCPSSSAGDYTLIGWQQPSVGVGVPIRAGLESSGTIACLTQGPNSPGTTSVNQTALITLDHRGFYSPQSWGSQTTPSGALAAVLFPSDATWPAALVNGQQVQSPPTAGQSAAYAYLSNIADPSGTGDIRSEYHTGVTSSTSGASIWQNNVEAVTCNPAPANQGFTSADLCGVQAELVAELSQVSAVGEFQTSMETVLQDVQTGSSTTLDVAYQNVATNIGNVSQTQSVLADFIGTFGSVANDVFGVIPGLNVAGAGIDIVAQITSMSLNLAQEKAMTGAVTQLARLTTQWKYLEADTLQVFQQQTNTISTLASLAAVDPTRLSALATAVGPYNSTIANSNEAQVASGLINAATITFYSALLPTQYQLYQKLAFNNANPTNATGTSNPYITLPYPNPSDPGGYVTVHSVVCDAAPQKTCGAEQGPDTAAGSVYFDYLAGPSNSSQAPYQWGLQFMAGGVSCGGSSDCHAKWPNTSVLSALFDTPSSGGSGLGVYAGYFYGLGGPLSPASTSDFCYISRTSITACDLAAPPVITSRTSTPVIPTTSVGPVPPAQASGPDLAATGPAVAPAWPLGLGGSMLILGVALLVMSRRRRRPTAASGRHHFR